MSELKATPGPWQRSPSKESGGSFIEHIDAEYVSHVVAFVHASHGIFDPPVATEEDAANAHLIAAAPELYEALEAARSDMKKGGISTATMRKVVDALAKARGE
ncbi:hypothetical protein [Halomonas sp. E14]|uniref:hypothetical protein n=1 Tax=Halomonas sp. E14 TaxID=3397245 RepID=UPI00403EF515